MANSNTASENLDTDAKKTGEESLNSGKKKPDPIIQVLKRNKDLEKRTQKALSVNVILAITCIASIAANVYVGTRPPPPPKYIIQNADGSLLETIPLNRPIANKASVGQVASDAILKMHALDFKNFRTQLNEASVYFTKNGWSKYELEMQRSGTFDAIQRRQIVMNATINNPPVVVKEYAINRHFAWDVEIPFTVNYFGAGFNTSSQMIAQVTLVRIQTTEHPRGVAIAGFNARRAN